ncbi:MerR family transcriptional regulator [Streptomyces sp. NPDC058613]|uniref:MerR family transcriptional regulator n=1 Tax=Streptomyces sp. NPDC058613 TaxID=3346556 RepID=UPI00365E36AF
MLIGAMSRHTGVSERLLRYYEEQGLLKPRRRSSGFREYSEEDVLTVRYIRSLLAAGLSTHAIAELMPCMIGNGQIPAPVCTDMLVGLHRERQRISDTAAGLLAARDVLDTVIVAARPRGTTSPEADRASETSAP